MRIGGSDVICSGSIGTTSPAWASNCVLEDIERELDRLADQQIESALGQIDRLALFDARRHEANRRRHAFRRGDADVIRSRQPGGNPHAESPPHQAVIGRPACDGQIAPIVFQHLRPPLPPMIPAAMETKS